MEISSKTMYGINARNRSDEWDQGSEKNPLLRCKADQVNQTWKTHQGHQEQQKNLYAQGRNDDLRCGIDPLESRNLKNALANTKS